MKTCTIDWCENKHQAKWFCKKHYRRLRFHWDPMKLKIAQKSNRKNNPLYDTYNRIKSRTLNINNKAYDRYWWRGITICDRRLWIYWFDKFCEDMWPRPEWYSIDRIDNNKWYFPQNCRRANIHEQACNKRNNNIVVGVSYDKKNSKYKSYITIEWKTIYLWRHKTIEDASIVRKKAEIKYNIYK